MRPHTPPTPAVRPVHTDRVSDAPVELIALDGPYEGVISARREGEPSCSHVQDVADAIMAALARGVDLVVPAALFHEIRGDFPPDLPPYVTVR
jgi:hypothetical protein